jgi:hypothetical protein
MLRQHQSKTNCFAKLASASFVVFCLAFVFAATVRAQNSPSPSAGSSPASSSQSSVAGTQADDDTVPRGKKLVLKDGSFQLVRDYEIDGDRVRYYDLDTHEWEEMPASMVDWDATKKEAASEAKQDQKLLNAVSEREKEENPQLLSVDASIEPAPGVFLPPDVGLFAFDGKKIYPVKQADMKSSVSKGRMLEKVLIPVPIIPTRHVISIVGTRAKLRFTNGQPEFYFRTADGSEPEIDLVRAKVRHGEREVEDVDELMGETAEARKDIALQRWHIASDVYRYTIAKPLDPGEYVLVQTVGNDQVSIYLWDFAIDPNPK